MLNKHRNVWRSITVGRLAEILATLPSDAHLFIGPTGNPVLADGEIGREDDWRYLGYIDLAIEEYEAIGATA